MTRSEYWLHEWAHALVHIGLLEDDRLRVTRDDSLWPRCLQEATSIYEGLDSELHERLAQLLTFHGLQSIQAAATAPEAKAVIERIAGTFKELMQRAPREYWIDDYVQVPKHRIVQEYKVAQESYTRWNCIMGHCGEVVAMLEYYLRQPPKPLLKVMQRQWAQPMVELGRVTEKFEVRPPRDAKELKPQDIFLRLFSLIVMRIVL